MNPIKGLLAYLKKNAEEKQPRRGVLRKMCFENMKEIYRRTPLSKFKFNKVAKQSNLLKSHFGMGVLF